MLTGVSGLEAQGAPARATSGGYGSVTQLAEGDPKCIRVYTEQYHNNYSSGRERSKENKSRDSLCQE